MMGRLLNLSVKDDKIQQNVFAVPKFRPFDSEIVCFGIISDVIMGCT